MPPAASSSSSIKDSPPTQSKPSKTCDNCRKRKIRCILPVDPSSHRPETCDGCRKIGLECTYDYVKKKPGRKNSFLPAKQEEPDSYSPNPPSLSASTSTTSAHHPLRNSFVSPSFAHAPSASTSRHYFHPYPSNPNPNPPNPGPYSPLDLTSTVFRSTTSPFRSVATSPFDPIARYTIQSPLATPAAAHVGMPEHPQPHEHETNGHMGSQGHAGASNSRPFSSFAFSPSLLRDTSDPTMSWLDGIGANIFEPPFSTAPSAPISPSLGFPSNPLLLFPSEQAHLLSLESPENLLLGGSQAGSTGSKPGHLANLIHPTRQEPQLEDVTSWANISHFISLFLQYLYPLEPLVHRPTFAEDLATRRDRRDTDFRALLLSIVAYVISQLPTSRLVNDQFDIDGLKKLQRRCHRTGKLLQRTYYGTTNTTQICTIIFDTFYLLSIGLGHTAGSRLAQAINLAFSMGMHSDSKTASLGLDCIETQLRRRVFWQLYCSDKTRAIPGPPMLINDFQGVCSLPEPVDDEFITSQGMFPQPLSRTSVLSGFVNVCQTFRILSECFFHHRCILSGVAAGSTAMSPLGFAAVGTEWTVKAEERLHEVLRDMPKAIQEPSAHHNESLRRVFAMQRANILITAAICKFALYDLRAALHVDEEQLSHEREAIAREIHALLMKIDVEDLASNGESVRGKVFHIACALCAQSPRNEADQELIKDWCEMFSAISFVQMPPPPPGAVDSRAQSPVHVGQDQGQPHPPSFSETGGAGGDPGSAGTAQTVHQAGHTGGSTS